MALTKKDLSQIKGVVHGEVETAVDTLAGIVNKAFQAVEKRFEFIDKRLELIEKRITQIEAEIRHVNARLSTIEHDIASIRKHLVYRDEFEEAIARIALIEKKLGIRSAK